MSIAVLSTSGMLFAAYQRVCYTLKLIITIIS